MQNLLENGNRFVRRSGEHNASTNAACTDLTAAAALDRNRFESFSGNRRCNARRHAPPYRPPRHHREGPSRGRHAHCHALGRVGRSNGGRQAGSLAPASTAAFKASLRATASPVFVEVRDQPDLPGLFFRAQSGQGLGKQPKPWVFGLGRRHLLQQRKSRVPVPNHPGFCHFERISTLSRAAIDFIKARSIIELAMSPGFFARRRHSACAFSAQLDASNNSPVEPGPEGARLEAISLVEHSLVGIVLQGFHDLFVRLFGLFGKTSLFVAGAQIAVDRQVVGFEPKDLLVDTDGRAPSLFLWNLALEGAARLPLLTDLAVQVGDLLPHPEVARLVFEQREISLKRTLKLPFCKPKRFLFESSSIDGNRFSLASHMGPWRRPRGASCARTSETIGRSDQSPRVVTQESTVLVW